MEMTNIVDAQVGKQLYADWQQQWDLQHPTRDQYDTSRSAMRDNERRSKINDLLDYLTTNQGCLSEIRVYMRRGSLSVIAESEDCRGSSWYIENGILPTECESILNLLSEYDGESVDMVKEELIGATLATVLHLRGVKNPIGLADHMREEYCLASWLENVRIHPARAGRDVWDTFAEIVQSDWDTFVRQAEFDAKFPPNGPSGETIVSLLAIWTWPKIMQYARQRGFKGKLHALEARASRYRNRVALKKRRVHAKQAIIQSSDAFETLADRIAHAKPRFMKTGNASDTLADRIVNYLRGIRSASAELIASALGEDAEKVLKILKANPDRFIRDRDGRWTLKSPT